MNVNVKLGAEKKLEKIIL